jgi:hypothetical protein
MGLVPTRGKFFLFASEFRPDCLFPQGGKAAAGMKLRLRMCGTVPPLPYMIHGVVLN